MTRPADVLVAGAGPAGLATAIVAARAGLEVFVCERRDGPPDKACGEGLMPAGVEVLEELGVRTLLGPGDASPIEAIRWIDRDGSAVEARLPGRGGLGVRRTALASALARRAVESGATLRWGCRVDGFERDADGVAVRTADGVRTTRVLVAADGLHSRLRRQAGLALPPAPRPRFGLRQHFALAPWSRSVEVHLGDGLEAFVTPAGEGRIGLAFLWERDAIAGPVTIADLLGRFPVLAGRLAGAVPASRPLGAGPLEQSVAAVTADRLALVGDAAGYVDAVTGEGVTLALRSARALGQALPQALARGADRAALEPYARVHRREFRTYGAVCRALLGLTRSAPLRRAAVSLLGPRSALLDRILAVAVG